MKKLFIGILLCLMVTVPSWAIFVIYWPKSGELVDVLEDDTFLSMYSSEKDYYGILETTALPDSEPVNNIVEKGQIRSKDETELNFQGNKVTYMQINELEYRKTVMVLTRTRITGEGVALINDQISAVDAEISRLTKSLKQPEVK